MKEQNSNIFFVEIKDPDKVRRDILETLKSILEVLHRFEKFKQLRHAKLEKINRLRDLMKRTNKIMGDLKAKLPKTNLKIGSVKEEAAAPKKAFHKKGKKAKPAEESAPKKEPSDVERLESQLGAIESKLKELT